MGWLSAGASLLGGLFSKDETSKANAANLAFQREQAAQQQKNFEKNFEYQDLANRSAIQWRKEDETQKI